MRIDGVRSTYPRSARERSRVIIHVVCALDVANSKHIWCCVNIESPISNGLTTVARYGEKIQPIRLVLGIRRDVRGARTRYRFV
jgi:hypothetical protein